MKKLDKWVPQELTENQKKIIFLKCHLLLQQQTISQSDCDLQEKRSRGGKVGLHCNKLNYQSVLPKLEFENGRMTGFTLLPLELNFDRKDKMNGLPQAASGAEAMEILELINFLSKPYGTEFEMSDGTYFSFYEKRKVSKRKTDYPTFFCKRK